MEDDIKSKIDLYRRLTTPMEMKIKEIKKMYGVNLSTIELFNYLEAKVWKNKINLTISEIVEDIFNLDINELLKHIETRRYNDKEINEEK